MAENQEKTEFQESVLKLEGYKENFILGGLWSVTDKSSKDSLLKLAKTANENLYEGQYLGAACLETPDINEMQAFGIFKTTGKNIYSLAECLAKSYLKEKSTANSIIINMLPIVLDNGKKAYWINVIENGVVQVDGDKIVDGDNIFEIENALHDEFDELNPIFFRAEDTAASLDYIQQHLQVLSKKDIKSSKIISFVGTRKLIIKCVIAAILVIAAAVFGYHWWEEHEAAKKAVEERMRLEQQAQRRLDAMKKSEFPPIWLNEPTTKNILFAINEQLQKTPLVINGWTLKAFRYAKGKYGAAYTRKNTDPYTPPPGKLEGKGHNNSIVVTNANVTKGARHQGILRKAKAEDWLTKMSIGRPWKLIWSVEKRPSKSVNIGNQQITINAAYQTCKVTLSGITNLETAANILDVPGFVLDSAMWNGKDWVIKGTLYILP